MKTNNLVNEFKSKLNLKNVDLVDVVENESVTTFSLIKYFDLSQANTDQTQLMTAYKKAYGRNIVKSNGLSFKVKEKGVCLSVDFYDQAVNLEIFTVTKEKDLAVVAKSFQDQFNKFLEITKK